MLVVGLTGGIATGKSTVSTLLKSHSVTVVDADIIAREVVLPGTRAHSEIISFFGHDILLPDGNIDRPKLGAVIFGDGEKRRKLNSIVHPAVRKAMLLEVLKNWIRGKRYCVIDVPLLVETGLHKWVGQVVLVSCSEEIQLNRLKARDKSTEEAALSRVRSQMPISEKVSYADIVIDNNGELSDLEDNVLSLVQELGLQTRWAWVLEWTVPPIGIFSALLTLASRALKRRCTMSVSQLRRRNDMKHLNLL